MNHHVAFTLNVSEEGGQFISSRLGILNILFGSLHGRYLNEGLVILVLSFRKKPTVKLLDCITQQQTRRIVIEIDYFYAHRIKTRQVTKISKFVLTLHTFK